MTKQAKTTTIDLVKAKAIIEKLVPIYTEIETLNEDAKAVLEDAKESGIKPAMLSKIAKARASSKLGDLQETTEKLLNLIEDTV
jgi:uncharacterized protein (UPF0335 family)